MPEFIALQPHWMVCTLPMAPSRIHSHQQAARLEGVALVAHLRDDLFSLAALAIARHSATEWANGFSQ